MDCKPIRYANGSTRFSGTAIYFGCVPSYLRSRCIQTCVDWVATSLESIQTRCEKVFLRAKKLISTPEKVFFFQHPLRIKSQPNCFRLDSERITARSLRISAQPICFTYHLLRITSRCAKNALDSGLLAEKAGESGLRMLTLLFRLDRSPSNAIRNDQDWFCACWQVL